MTVLLPVGALSCSWPALLSLLSVTVMLVGCKEEHPVTEAPTPVRVQRIEVETGTEARTYTGVVRARYESDLSFRVAGKIVERLVNVDSPRGPTPSLAPIMSVCPSRLQMMRSSAGVAGGHRPLRQHERG